jgi:HEAT repeat protein
MKRRVLIWSGGSIALALGVAFLIPSSRYSMLGYLRGESFDSGRPQSYWVNALWDADPEVRQEGATCLARLGPQAADAIPALMDLLKDERPEVRTKAAFALFKIHVKASSAVPSLCDGLKDSSPGVRLYCSMCLAGMGPEAQAALPDLIEAVKDKKNGVHLFPSPVNTRQLAVVALGHMGPCAREAVPFLLALLVDEDHIVREVAIRALGQIRSPDSIPALMIILEDEKHPLRLDAAAALGGIGSEAQEAVPTLCRMLKHRSPFVRRAAETAVRQIDPSVDLGSRGK